MDTGVGRDSYEEESETKELRSMLTERLRSVEARIEEYEIKLAALRRSRIMLAAAVQTDEESSMTKSMDEMPTPRY